MADKLCYNCSPTLTHHRYLCPRCRSLYTFASDGRMRTRKTGEPGTFELKGPISFGQFVRGRDVEAK